MIIYVPTTDLQTVLNWDKAKFAGVNIKITADVVTELFNTTIDDATPTNSSTRETINILEEVLRTRYNPETKMLDLTKLGQDPNLKLNGFFELNSTTSKMFPALMSIADKKFETAQQKRELIQSVDLSGNQLTSIAPVTTLSITFPDLKNLSLENNVLEDFKSIESWKNRFKTLEQLVMTGNPITNLPGYREEIIRRYPKLTMLDGVAVDRTHIQVGEDQNRILPVQNPSTAVDAAGRPVFPLSTKGNCQVGDDSAIVIQFLGA